MSVSVSISLSVCVFVCPRTYLRNYTSSLHQFCVHAACVRGSVLLWQRNDTFYTSGFIDDVTFGHKPRLINVAAQLKRSVPLRPPLLCDCYAGSVVLLATEHELVCYSAPDRGAEFCEERVCLSVSVCLSVRDSSY